MKIDLAGQQFGRWRVIAPTARRGETTYWLCRCDCGIEREVATLSLRRNRSLSCGCLSREINHKRLRDLTGRQFGRWLVLQRVEDKGMQPMWLCLCECGTRSSVTGYTLRKGLSTSCGCYMREVFTNLQHGATKGRRWSREYQSWSNMKARCLNPKHEHYKYYGGRGITICDQWLHSFANFFIDMGRRPNKMTIDRVDNAKGYAPDNCRWASAKTQRDNQGKSAA